MCRRTGGGERERERNSKQEWRTTKTTWKKKKKRCSSQPFVLSSQRLFLSLLFLGWLLGLNLKAGGGEWAGVGVGGRGLAVLYKCIRRNFKNDIIVAGNRKTLVILLLETNTSICFSWKLRFLLKPCAFCLLWKWKRKTRCNRSRCKRKPTRWMVLAVTRHCSLLPLGYV